MPLDYRFTFPNAYSNPTFVTISRMEAVSGTLVFIVGHNKRETVGGYFNNNIERNIKYQTY